MSKAVRNNEGKYTQRKSMKVLVAWWLSAAFSLVTVWFAARALAANLGGFRACSGDTPILSVSSCGKQSLDIGDVILFGLLVLTCCFAFSIITAAWRATNKGSVIK